MLNTSVSQRKNVSIHIELSNILPFKTTLTDNIMSKNIMQIKRKKSALTGLANVTSRPKLTCRKL